ncbi:MAG: N-acetyl-gamma-glutamyl-phosphate reductase [Candidatus Kapabacteria bacterium]|nr:N-acetyl-gamma-glutamyl-phosphate reductase [Candidatus Kapabacteria bacterium]
MDKKKIGIIGATGYTGSELVRILKNHPDVEIHLITSESRAGERFSDVHPFFQGIEEQELQSINQIENYDLDLVFLALPHGVSMEFVKKFHDKPFSIIDLSGDFRLKPKVVYEEWYKMEHIYPKGIDDAVFGIPELFADEIKNAKLIANPGCFPTSAILGAAPLVIEGYVETNYIIVDSKSGVTGAGIKSKPVNLFSNVNDNFRAYGIMNHRHTIEIQNTLEHISKQETIVQFTPHLLPVDRGILSTIYLRPKKAFNKKTLTDVYESFYKDKPFVRMRNQAPAIKDVRGTNYCDIHLCFDERTNMIIIVSVIDNLVKGAAGQAVQNMNIIFGLDEKSGLIQIPMNP